jgi:hypothetical protein
MARSNLRRKAAARRPLRRAAERTRAQLRRDLVELYKLCFHSYAGWAAAAGVSTDTARRFARGTGSWHRDTTVYKLAHAVGAEVLVGALPQQARKAA